MYTHSDLTFGAESVLSIYNFKAGYALSSTVTDYLKHPYNPSEAKPMHIVWEMDSDSTSYNDSFNTTISGDPRMVEFYCIIGRDGMNTSDWTVAADNTRNCAPLSADPLSANVPANMQQGQPPRPDHGKKVCTVPFVEVLSTLGILG